LNNSGFKPVEFDRFKMEAGSNYFVLSPQRWIDATNAVGIVSRSGRYGGTYAHEDIDFKVVEFDHFKMQAGLPRSPGQWIEKTNAIGIFVKQGKEP
jgi:hypothetical protein